MIGREMRSVYVYHRLIVALLFFVVQNTQYTRRTAASGVWFTC